MLSKKEARNLIEAWAQTELTKYEGWKIASIIKKNVFRIRWAHPEHGTTFDLLRGKVRSDGSILIFEDFRKYVTEILTTPHGLQRESRLFAALEVRTKYSAEWFLKAERASPYAEKRGVDGIAHIQVGDNVLKIPFQIKSSRTGRRKFERSYPQYVGLIGVIYVWDHDDDDKLRQQMYSLLGIIRSKMLKENISVADMQRRITEVVFSKSKK